MFVGNRDDHNSSLLLDFPAAGRLISNIFHGKELPEAEEIFPHIQGYAIDHKLGKGGGGQVYRARRESNGQSVAIKLLNRTIRDHNGNSRAMRELDLLSELEVPGIPPVEDYGLHGDRMYIVTAHIEGLTLRDHCEQNNLDARARVGLLAKVADAVQRLHEKGVLHRDIKPDNIIINENGEPIIIDFGIAALTADDAAETLTQDGAPIGSPAFMSPEQARGERASISTRSDVYSIGATACLLLTGKTPHDVSGPLHAAIRRVAEESPRNPQTLNPSLDGSLAHVLSRALSAAPDERYPSAAALAEDLRRWLRNEPIDWQRPNWLKRQALAWRRNPKLYFTRMAIAATVLICVSVAADAFARAGVAEQRAALAEKELDLHNKEVAQLEHFKSENERLTQLSEEIDRQRLKMVDLEKNRITLRKNQVARAKEAERTRAFLDGSIILLNIAEEIEFNKLNDAELVTEYARAARALIETAIQEAAEKALQQQPE